VKRCRAAVAADELSSATAAAAAVLVQIEVLPLLTSGFIERRGVGETLLFPTWDAACEVKIIIN
jgi:hypothetical protein